MIRSKAIELIKNLTIKETEELSEFLNSPFINKNETMNALYNALIMYYPDFDNAGLSYRSLHEKIYAQAKPQKYNEATVRNLLSDLTLLIREYFALKRLRKDKTGILAAFQDEMLEREMVNEYLASTNAFEKIMHSDTKRDAAYYYEEMMYAARKHNAEIRKINFDTYVNSFTSRPYTDNLKKYYAASVFNAFISDALSNYGKIEFNKSHESLYDELSALLSEFDSEDFEIRLQCLNFLRTKQHKDYFSFCTGFMGNEHLFDFDIARNFYLLLRMYSFQKSIENREFINENIKIVNAIAEKGYMKSFKNGYIFDTDYRTYVIVCCQQGMMEKAEKFIEENRLNLRPHFGDSNYLYCKAHIAFYKKEFKSALNILSKIVYDDHHLHLLTASLSLRLMYELKYIEQAYSALDSLSGYINKNKNVSADEKMLFRNFNGLYKELLKIELNDKKALNELHEKVSAAQTISKQWLLEKTKTS